MTARRLLSSLTPATGIALGGCKSATRESRDGTYAVTIDLNKIAPIGYEVCADRPPRLSRANLDLRLQLPSRIEIPPSQQKYGAKYVEFKPGQHEIDVYRELHSPDCSLREAVSLSKTTYRPFGSNYKWPSSGKANTFSESAAIRFSHIARSTFTDAACLFDGVPLCEGGAG
jgi:hypothetical protein